MDGRPLVVNEARPKPEGGFGGSGGGRPPLERGARNFESEDFSGRQTKRTALVDLSCYSSTIQPSRS